MGLEFDSVVAGRGGGSRTTLLGAFATCNDTGGGLYS